MKSRFAVFGLASALVVAAFAVNGQTSEFELWDKAQTSKRRVDYETYLSQYPNGRYAGRARAALEASAPPTAPTAPTVSPQSAQVHSAQNEGARFLVSAFAIDMCDKTRPAGRAVDTELSADGRAQLRSVLKKLASAGNAAAVRYQTSEHEQSLQADILAATNSPATCRTQISQLLGEKLAIPGLAQPSGGGQASVQREAFGRASGGTIRYGAGGRVCTRMRFQGEIILLHQNGSPLRISSGMTKSRLEQHARAQGVPLDWQSPQTVRVVTPFSAVLLHFEDDALREKEECN